MAAMTLRELEQWLTEYITGVYHAKLHRGIGMSPLQKWRIGTFGDGDQEGSGILARPTDVERVKLDFMPFLERTIQPTGVSIDGISYYDAVLRRFIGASDAGRKRTFIFRRDPRDISVVHFWDPELQRYSAIPYRNTTHPSISVWELRELRRRLHDAGTSSIDETAVFEAHARLREREAQATTETKRIRRARARRQPSSGAKLVRPSEDAAKVELEASLPSFVDIEPYADTEAPSVETHVPTFHSIEPYEIEGMR